MDTYPKEIVEGVTPLIFAVDAVFRNEEDNDTNQKSTAFETFFHYISAKRLRRPSGNFGKGDGDGDVHPSSDPLTGVFRTDPKSSDFFSHANVVPVSRRHAFPPSKDPSGSNNSVAKLNSALYAARRQKYVAAPVPMPPVYHNPSASASANASVHSGSNSSSAGSASAGPNHNHASHSAATTITQANLPPPPTKISAIASILSKTPIQGILPSGWIEKHTHALPSTLLVVTALDLTSTSYQQALLEQQLSTSIHNITSSCANKRVSPVHLVCLIKYDNPNQGIGTPKELAIETERLGSIKSSCRLGNGSVTPLRYFEEADGRTIYVQNDVRKLQKAVEGDSMLYYLTQVRRCKKKHSLLHHGKFLDLLPFAARYCIKIAVFYEFQDMVDRNSDKEKGGKKSSKYWAEAYKNIQDYYLHLQGESGALHANVNANANRVPMNRNSIKNLMDIESESQVTGVPSLSSAGVGGGQEDESASANADIDYTRTRSQESINDGDDGSSMMPPPPPDSDGVEVALVYSPKSGGKNIVDPPRLISESSKESQSQDQIISDYRNFMTHSEDMLQQCRAVADLLNIKLLLTDYAMALRSLSDVGAGKENPEDVTFAHIAKQIRTHSQIFLTRSSSLSGSSSTSIGTGQDPTWLFLAYVARQQLVISEFLQRHPIRISSNHLTTLDKETPMYCNTFHHYITCCEAFLRLGVSVNRARVDWQAVDEAQLESEGNDGRQRYVGCVGGQDLVDAWKEESSRDHQALAIGYLKTAIEVFSRDQFSFTGSKKLLARAYYLMAGIFMSKGDFDSASEHLQLVLPLVDSFPSIRIAAELAMKRCWEERNSKQPSETTAKLLLDSYCNRLLSRDDMTAMKMSLAGDSPRVYWRYNDESSQPLHYSFTFPLCSYATEGDTVEGTLHLHSNLPFPVKVENISLNMSAGSVVFNNVDMPHIQPNETVTMSTKVSIPNGCMKDADVKILERQMVKKPRRNTFGLTKIGGGVYAQDTNNKLSGGMCVSCLGAEISLLFPDSDNTRILVNLENSHRGSFAVSNQGANQDSDQKRISLEEDNFVYSAWSRPDFFPMHLGPRCIRILRAQSQLEIIDLTSPLVKNKAMIGTVNKFLLKLKAGNMEQCKNLKMRVSCSSWLDVSGSSEEISNNGEAVDSELVEPNMLPVLVAPSSDLAVSSSVQDDTFVLPRWKKISGNESQGQSHSEWAHIADSLNCGLEMLTSFQLYKPLAANGSEQEFQCKTKFTVDISYNQIRLDQSNNDQEREPVIQTYRGVIAWCAPFDAEFKVLPKNQGSTPSGSRHPANAVGSNAPATDNIAVLSGSFVAVTCSLKCTEAASHLAAEVGNIDFESHSEDTQNKKSCVSLVQGKEGSRLYAPKPDDFCNKLKLGSTLKLTYTARTELRRNEKSDRLQITATPLGCISISFRPLPLYNPENIQQLNDKKDDFVNNHGPLPLEGLPPLKRTGPIVYVEATPFEASFSTIPSIPKVAAPFEVRYSLTNKTELQQRIKVSMVETEGTSNGMLVSGVINGEIVLGPMESKVLRYSLLVTKVGKTILPTLNVSCLRYNSWIIRGGEKDSVYVLP